MNPGLQALLGALSLVFVFGAASSIGAAGVGAILRRVPLSAGWRAAVLLLTLAAPLLMVLTLLIAGFLPSLLDALGLASDNCTPDHTHHPHLCFLHPSAALEGLAVWLCWLGAAWLLVPLAKATRRLIGLRSARLSSTLLLSEHDLPEAQREALTQARSGLEVPIQLVRSPLPMAALTGLLRPRVLLSSALLERLSTEELQAVLHHEAAHEERRDLLAGTLAGVFAAFHLPVVGRWLYDQYHNATEEACDELAAVRLGTGLTGASALLSLLRWSLATRRALELPAGMTIGIARLGDPKAAEQRILRLLEWRSGSRGERPFTWRLWAPTLGLLVAILMGSETIHHLIEDLLGLLSG